MSKRWVWFAVILAVAMPSMAHAVTNISACRTPVGSDGLYAVTQNLTNPDNTAPCLTVTAGRVTIDLGGYVISGAGGSVGIATTQPFLSVSNGTIRWFGTGIKANNQAGVKLDNLRVNASGSNGAVLGVNSQVTDCGFFGNGSGLVIGDNCVVRGNRFSQNGPDGITAGSNCTIEDNVSQNNGGIGIWVNTNSLVTGNVSTNNSGTGMQVAGGSIVANNNSSSNSGHGINVNAANASIQNNLAQGNTSIGIAVVCPSNVIGNTALSNATNISSSGAGCASANNLAP